MKNIILTLLSIPKIGRKSVDYFIDYMKEEPQNEKDRKSTRLNSSHRHTSRMPSSA